MGSMSRFRLDCRRASRESREKLSGKKESTHAWAQAEKEREGAGMRGSQQQGREGKVR